MLVPDRQEVQGCVRGPVRPRPDLRRLAIFFIGVAALGVALASLWLPARGAEETTTSASAPVALRRLWRCGEVCDKGVTAADGALAESTLRSQGEHLEESLKDLTQVCMWRCREGLKEVHEEHGVPPLHAFTQTPPLFRTFAAAASERVARAEGRRPPDVAVADLEACGVAHIDDGLFDHDLISELRAAYEELRDDADEW